MGTDAALDTLTGDYTGERISSLANAVYLRLMTPLGSWWAAPSVGSRLHELEREKDVARVRRLAVQYAEQALQPLVTDGRARVVSVAVSGLGRDESMRGFRLFPTQKPPAKFFRRGLLVPSGLCRRVKRHARTAVFRSRARTAGHRGFTPQTKKGLWR